MSLKRLSLLLVAALGLAAPTRAEPVGSGYSLAVFCEVGLMNRREPRLPEAMAAADTMKDRSGQLVASGLAGYCDGFLDAVRLTAKGACVPGNMDSVAISLLFVDWAHANIKSLTNSPIKDAQAFFKTAFPC